MEDDDTHCEELLIGPIDPALSMVIITESTDRIVFPPINHENLHSHGLTTYLDSQSDSSSPSSSSTLSPSSSSFSLSPSDSDGQSPLIACEFDQKSPPLSSDLAGESPPSDWWELLMLRVYSKLKTLVTWFTRVNLRSVTPVLAVAIWWWTRVRRRRVNGETIVRLRDTIKEKDERIVKLLCQIAQMNELLVKHHKDIVSTR